MEGSNKIAIVSGCNGQDGSYMADLLLRKGYTVIGTVRGKNPAWPSNFKPYRKPLWIYQLDLGYADSIIKFFDKIAEDFENPSLDYCFNFAAQSHVGMSFSMPEETYRVTGVGACLLMDAFFKAHPKGSFYQASSSEMLGGTTKEFSASTRKMDPKSPYAIAKLMAHEAVHMYHQRGHSAFAAILFNHESERRHESFVTQKVAKFMAEVHKWYALSKRGLEEDKPILMLGSGSSVRDWGYAPEYMEMIYSLMHQNFTKDWIIGTGEAHSVEEMVNTAFEYIGLDAKDFVHYNSTEFRPLDVEYLQADPEDARMLLGREPMKMKEVIIRMIDYQINRIE